MERIGIYGGTFNPPHIGHLRAAVRAREALALDKLILIPDRIAPHKVIPSGSPTPQQRLEMVQTAFRDCPEIEVSDLELRREGVSYSYQTVEELKQRYPHAQLILLMGTDMFLSFHTWKKPEIILENAALGVFFRGEKGEQAAIEAKKAEMEAAGHNIMLVENDRVLAVTMGSRMNPDTFDIHFEKAREDVDGAYTVVNQEFARYLRLKYPEAAYLDREDDMGLEGLRKAKLSYNPHHMVEKYHATCVEDLYDL